MRRYFISFSSGAVTIVRQEAKLGFTTAVDRLGKLDSKSSLYDK